MTNKLRTLFFALLCLAPCYGYAQVTPGFVPHEEDLTGVRLRSFGNSGGRELFVGVPDLGVGGNRVEIDRRWTPGDTPFVVSLDRTNDALTLQVGEGETDQVLTFENISQAVAQRTSGVYGLTDINLLQFDIAQRQEGVQVALIDVRVNGRPIGDLVPPSDGSFTWTVVNLCVPLADPATVSGTLRLIGEFSSSQELNKVDIKAGVRERDGLDCTRTGPQRPAIFKNGYEPQGQQPPEEGDA